MLLIAHQLQHQHQLQQASSTHAHNPGCSLCSALLCSALLKASDICGPCHVELVEHPSEVHQHKDGHCHWLACRQLTVSLGHNHQAALLQPCNADCLHGSQTLRSDRLERTWPQVLLVGLTGRQTHLALHACCTFCLKWCAGSNEGQQRPQQHQSSFAAAEEPSSGSDMHAGTHGTPPAIFHAACRSEAPSWKLTRRCLPLSITCSPCLLKQLRRSLMQSLGLCQ